MLISLYMVRAAVAVMMVGSTALRAELAKPVTGMSAQQLNRDRLAASVRIPISLQPHEPVQIRAHNGTVILQTKPGETLEFTLRGAINQPNQFYFANWRVETEPVLWKQDVREYATKLNIYKTFGEQHELEESIGSLEVRGHLVSESDKVFKLVGQKVAEFKTLEGNLKLVVKAGQLRIDESKPAMVSKLVPGTSKTPSKSE